MKTDRRDARKLARSHRTGELTAVNIPEVDDEVIRDVCRGRTDAVNVLALAKKQLLSFLLRNGYCYKGESHWNVSGEPLGNQMLTGTPGVVPSRVYALSAFPRFYFQSSKCGFYYSKINFTLF